MGEKLHVIGEFDIDKLNEVSYSDEIENVLKHFPASEKIENMRRLKTKDECKNKKEDEFFFLRFKSAKQPDGFLGLYSYVSAYLVGVADKSTLFILDMNELDLPDEYLNGRRKFDTRIGSSYRDIPVMEHGSKFALRDALDCFGRGEIGFQRNWWTNSLSIVIGFSSEAFRYLLLKNRLKKVFAEHDDDGGCGYVSLDMTMIWLIHNWGNVSKNLNQGEGYINVGHDRIELLCSVSLVTNKDGLPQHRKTAPTPILPCPLSRNFYLHSPCNL